MGSDSRQLAERIETIESENPEEIRRGLIDQLRAVVPSNLGLFVKLVENDAGVRFFTDDAMCGDSDAVGWLKSFVDQPVLDCPWFPEKGEPAVVNRFRRPKVDYGEDAVESFEVIEVAFQPIEGSTQMRAVICDGQRLLGWLGLVRRGTNERFRAAEEQRLQRAFGSIKSVLAAADALDRQELQRELFAVASPQGTLEHTSAAFRDWLDGERSEYLRRRIESFDAGARRGGAEIMAGADVRVVRLDGEHGVRYAVTVDRAELVRVRPELWLTPRQREVAELAVRGASNVETADILGVSRETVKSHLAEIYRRLRVDNRTELATLLAHVVK